jgi:DNA polymerase-4
MSLTTLFVDLNSYFASVEQELRPELRDKPVAVVPVIADTTVCIAASYEAKRFGVRTGTRVGQAIQMCPGLVLVQGRPATYVKFHHDVLAAADTILPVHAVHSIDEFSCRLMGTEREPQSAERLARDLKHAIAMRVGPRLRCSIGIAPNRVLAKLASDMQKPDGLVILRREELPDRLFHLDLIDLPGVGQKMQARLHAKGIRSIEQLVRMSEKEMAGAWESVVGRWWYHMLRGDEFTESASRRRSIGHSRVLAPQRRVDDTARAVAVRLLEKAAARARKLEYWSRRLCLAIRYLDGRNWAESSSFPECNDTLTLVGSLVRMWERRPRGTMLKVGVTLEELSGTGSATGALFREARDREGVARAMDNVNAKYGRATVFLASTQEVQSTRPDSIAWGSIPELEDGDVDGEMEEDL